MSRSPETVRIAIEATSPMMMGAEGGGLRDVYLVATALIGEPEDAAWRGIADSGQVRRHLTVTGPAILATMPMFRDQGGDDRALAVDHLRQILAAKAIEELQGIIAANPSDLTGLGHELLLTADDVEAVDQQRTKRCRFQRTDHHGLWCTVDVSGQDAPTSAPICLRCTLPDDSLRCSALAHPRIQRVQTMGTSDRIVAGALCNAGHDNRLGDLSRCVPGGHECWRMDIRADMRVPVKGSPPIKDISVPESRPDAVTVFVSYAHEDRPLAQAIADGLEDGGYHVWIDEGELVIGDSLVRRIADAVHATDFLVALVSQWSVDSSWCRKELALALTKGLNEVRELVLPVRVGEIEMPPELGDIVYGTPDEGEPSGLVRDLRRAIETHQRRRASDRHW